MTDRHAGYIVALAEDIREDDAEDILIALRMIKGVAGVQLVVSSPEVHIATLRAESAVSDRVYRALENRHA